MAGTTIEHPAGQRVRFDLDGRDRAGEVVRINPLTVAEAERMEGKLCVCLGGRLEVLVDPAIVEVVSR